MDELEPAGQLATSDILSLASNLLHVSGGTSEMEDYKLKIRVKRLELDGLVLDLSFLSVTEANRTLAEKSLDARSFLEAERSSES